MPSQEEAELYHYVVEYDDVTGRWRLLPTGEVDGALNFAEGTLFLMGPEYAPAGESAGERLVDLIFGPRDCTWAKVDEHEPWAQLDAVLHARMQELVDRLNSAK